MKKFSKYIIVNILLILFTAVMLLLHPVNDIRKYDIYNPCDFAEKVIIYGDKSISQEFTCSIDSDCIEIPAATVKLRDGVFDTVLRDETGSVLESWKTDEIELSGEWISFKCRDSVMRAGSRYIMEISAPECDIPQALVVPVGFNGYGSAKLGNIKCTNYADDEQDYYSDKAIGIATYKSHRNYFAYASILIVFIALNLCLKWKDKGVERIAPVVLISACLIMLLSLSPGSGLDDQYHYYSAFKLSNIMMGRENAGAVETMYAYDLVPDVNANYNFMNVLENIRYRKTGDGTSFVMDQHSDKLKWPISHFAPAIGITIGRLLRMNFIQIYTLGRIMSMFMYIVLALTAIRLTPVNKELMVLMASMPMVTQQATQITYDTIINGLAFLLVGYILKLMFDDNKISWKDAGIVMIIGGLMGPVKVIYAALVLLILAVPEKDLLSKRDHFLKKGTVVLAVFGVTVLNKFKMGKSTLTKTDVRVGRPGYTIGFAVHEPVKYIKMVISSIEDDLLFYLKQAVGSEVGGRDVLIPEYIIWGLIIVMLICVFCVSEEKTFTIFQKSVWMGVFIIGTGTLFAYFVFAATPYGDARVQGLQGRYFIPFTIPFIYALRSEKVNIKLERINLLIPFLFLEMGCLIRIMNQIDYRIM